MEEAQVEQLRASFRGQRAAISSLKQQLRTEHKQRSLAEASLSVITRHWDQLEQLLQDVTSKQDIPQSKSFQSTLEAVHAVLDADITYRRDRTIRVDALLDGPYNASDNDDDDDDDEDDETAATAKATRILLSESVEESVVAKYAWAKTAVGSLLAKSSGNGNQVTALEHSQLRAKLNALADTTIVLERQLSTTASTLDEQTYLNESLMRRLEAMRQNGSKQSENLKDAAKSGGSSGGSTGSSSSTTSSSAMENDMNGDAKKAMEELRTMVEELKGRLGLAEELSKSRLVEVEDLLKMKKVLDANLAKYESGDIPTDILERATEYVKFKREHDDNRRQLLAMSTNDTTMRDNMENMRKKHAKLEKEMNMAMHKLKGTYEDLVKSLAKEKQQYAAYADELKVKLQLQTRQATRIKEAEKREQELQKMIDNQRVELTRISERAAPKDDDDEKAQLSNEIEQLGEAFGKTEKQNLDLLKQLKTLKKQRLDHQKEKEVLKQQMNLSKQATHVLKDEASLARRAEALATSYAKQQESKLKGIKDQLEQVTEEKQILEREVAQHRAAQVRSLQANDMVVISVLIVRFLFSDIIYFV
jgi:hypothetical protein